MSRALDALRRFAQRQATPEQVMRELISYDGWFVPAGWAATDFGTNQFERACVWGEQSTIPPGQLWLFTDPEGGPRVQAKGVSPGPYVGPCRGSMVFEKIPAGITAVEINPCSPPEMAWFIGPPGIAPTRELGRAIALEQALVNGKDVVDRLLDFDGYWVMITPQGAIATAVGAAGMANPGLVFTTEDCRDAALRAVGPGAATLKLARMTGAALFGEFEKMGVDGLILNVSGPAAPKPLSAEACRGIGESLRGRAELARLEALANQET